jgi:hypothetical protein
MKDEGRGVVIFVPLTVKKFVGCANFVQLFVHC